MNKLKIVIIEDEPAAMRALSTIIERKCEDAEIVATAFNGQEGLLEIETHLPDVVFTDIKMPMMDGMEVSRQIASRFPFIHIVIISGFQDFGYAKQAMHYGVMDYLLKPMNIQQFQELITQLQIIIGNERREHCTNILKQLLLGKKLEPYYRDKYLPYNSLRLAVIRLNAISEDFYIDEHEHQHQHRLWLRLLELLHAQFRMDQLVWTQGNDSREFVVLFTEGALTIEMMKDKLEECLQCYSQGFITIAFTEETVTLEQLRIRKNALRKVIDQRIVIGKSQIIHSNDSMKNSPSKDKSQNLESSFQKKMEQSLVDSNWTQLKEDIEHEFNRWNEQELPQKSVEFKIKHLLTCILESIDNKNESLDYFYMMKEAISKSRNFNELFILFWDMIEQLIIHIKQKPTRIDSEDFFQAIIKYIENNLRNKISLQSVCDFFGISQTYMSKLFRKYKQMSFNEFVNQVRIHKAKELIKQDPSLSMKAVGECVGYTDPFYFSKVFKQITGTSPSAYSSESAGYKL